MNTSNPDDKSAHTDPTASKNPQSDEHAHASAGVPFEEYKKKLEERLAELGKQMETLKDLLSKAAHDAKQSLEQQLDKLQKDHSAEFERLGKLRAAGEAGLSTLGARLDKLVEDVTAAITSALGFAKPADAHKADGEAKADAPKADSEAKSDSETKADASKSDSEAKTDSADKADSEPKSDPSDKADTVAATEASKAPAEPISTDAAKYYAAAAHQSSDPALHPAAPASQPSAQSPKPAPQAQESASLIPQHAGSPSEVQPQGPASPVPQHSDSPQPEAQPQGPASPIPQHADSAQLEVQPQGPASPIPQHAEVTQEPGEAASQSADAAKKPSADPQ